MMSMSDMIDQLFDNAFVMPRDGGWANMPKVDVMENDNNVVVKAEMPGFDPENIDVRVEGNMLTLRGEVSQETQNEQEEGHYHVHERRMSSFARAIPLPSDVDAEGAQANFDNGILTLTLPKREEAKSKRINISGGGDSMTNVTPQSSKQEGKQNKQDNQGESDTAQAGSRK